MAKQKFYSKYLNEEIEKILTDSDEAPFVLYYDQANKLYRFFRTKERRDAWVEAYNSGSMSPEVAAYEFTGSFTAPAPYTLNINSIRDNQYVLYGSTGNLLEYSFQTVDGNGGEVNEAVDAYYTFKSSKGTVLASNIYNAGAGVSMNIDEYLQLGTNTITILLRGRSTNVSRTVVVTYYVVQLDISSTFDISRPISSRTNFNVTYTVEGQASKTVEFYIDGTLAATATVSSLESTATRTQIFNNVDGKYGPGKHDLQIRAIMMAGNEQFFSNILYYEFVITGINQTQIMIEQTFPPTNSILVDELPGLTGEQYVTTTFKWAYYSSDPLKQTATIQWRLFTEEGTETTLATRNADVVEAETDKIPDPLSFMPTEYGNYQLQALIEGNIIESYTISVIQNTAGIYEATEGLTMKLSGLGRSNDEPAETLTSWADRGYSTTFSNQPWNNNSGWNDDALWLNNGATCIINNKPFAREIAPQSNNGCVVEIDFETFNIDEDTAEVFRIGGNTGPSLVITGSKAVLRSNDGVELVARFKSDERVKLAFIVCPNSSGATQYPQMLFVQNNGVLSQGENYLLADTFNIGSSADTTNPLGMINIGNADGLAGIKVYYLRTYNTAINMYEELNNFFIDSGANLQRLVSQNDIYTPGTKQIDVDKLEALITTVKITGDVNILLETQQKATISGGLEVTCPSNPNINITCDKAQYSNAGQSTLGLPVPSMHVKLDKNNNVTYDRDGKPLVKNRWAFREGNVPEKKFRLQANYMDSSGCHNGAFFRMFNEVAPKVRVGSEYVLRMPSENYALENYPEVMKNKYGEDPSGAGWKFPYTLHMVPDSIPCVVVWRETANDPYKFLGQYVLMEEKKSNYTNGMHSIYDTLDPEGKPDPFKFNSSGGNRLWNNEDCRQFEILRSSEDLTLFINDSDWSTTTREMAFEMEYPDPDDVIADYESGASSMSLEDYWMEFKNELVTPICNSYHNQSAFNALYGTKLNRWHFAAYYCLMLRNCCVDSVVRNMELTTYDLRTWLPKWWDNDMECGLQQSGECNIEPCSDRNTLVPGTTTAYAFAGRDASGRSSWLWDGLEGCSQFMNDVKTMDQALYEAGWTYDAMTKTQDQDYIDTWSESLYNESGVVKYIDYDHLLNLQGDRTSHRHWFLRTSYDYFDAKNVCGEYKSKAIYMRTLGIHTGNVMRFKAGAASQFGWGTTTEIRETGIAVGKGESFEITVNIGTSVIQYNDPVQIYAANKLEEADFSDVAQYLYGELQFGSTYDKVTGSYLKKLIIGIPKEKMYKVGTTNGLFNTFTGISGAISGLETMPRLEEFNVQGLYSVTSLELSGMSSLKYFYAAGSSLTSFNPASGTTIYKAELPTTIASMDMNGVTLTYNGDCSISWWHTETAEITETREGTSYNVTTPIDITETTVPTSLRFLRFVGMGRDLGTQILVRDWIRAIAALGDPDAFNSYELRYTTVNWVGMDINDLLNIAKIPASQRTLTGYIKCTGEFTTQQMSALMDAFGSNIFSTSNNLCIDCESERIIVSAVGSNTTVNDGVIETLQGTTAQLQAVGFPLVGNDATYQWFIKLSETDYRTGDDNLPNITFGLNNLLHYKTGALVTSESSADTTDFTIYVERSTGGNGTATLRVVKRTYPTDAEVSLVSSQAPVEMAEGVYQILSTGFYLFGATHTPAGYTGRLKELDGGVWQVDGYNEGFVVRDENSYSPGKDGNEQYCLHVVQMPAEELNLVLNYTSNWRNNLTITAPPVNICLITVIPGVLTTSSVNGNPALFAALNAAGVLHSDNNAYNSLELKKATGTLNIKSLVEAGGFSIDGLRNFNSGTGGIYNIAKFLKNVTGLNLAGCEGLIVDIDISGTTNYKTLDMTGTSVNAILGTESTLTSLTLGTPREVEIDSPLFLEGDNISIESINNIQSLILKSFHGNTTFLGASVLMNGDLDSIEHLIIYQTPSVTETITGDVVENMAKVLADLDTDSNMTGHIFSTKVYQDSKTALQSRFPSLTIDNTTYYIRFLDQVFEDLIQEDFGDGIGTTQAEIQGITDFGDTLKGQTSVTNLGDLNLFTSLEMPTLNDETTSQFYGCTGIQNIKFPSTLEKIGTGTFTGLSSLGTLDFSVATGLETIEEGAFRNCGSSNLVVDLSNCSSMVSADLGGLEFKDLIVEGNDSLGLIEFTVPSNA